MDSYTTHTCGRAPLGAIRAARENYDDTLDTLDRYSGRTALDNLAGVVCPRTMVVCPRTCMRKRRRAPGSDKEEETTQSAEQGSTLTLTLTRALTLTENPIITML